jgi:hypothetical protein
VPQPTETGLLAIPLVALSRLIASSATFRTLVSAATATLALNHIYYQEVSDVLSDVDPPTMLFPRPRALCYLAENFQFTRTGPGSWEQTGSVCFAIEATPPAPYLGDLRGEAVWFLNQVGSIVEEMSANSGGTDGTNPYLNVIDFQIVNGPMPAVTSDETGHFWGCEIECSDR